MSKRNITAFIFQWVAPVVVLVCAGFFVYAMGTRPKPDRKKTPPRQTIPVQVVRVQQHNGGLDIQASGVAIPHREVELSARVGGEVVFKSDVLSPGNYVRKGQLLLEIDPEDYQLEVTRLEQEVEKVNVELESLAIELEYSKRLLKIHGEVASLREQNLTRSQELRLKFSTSETEMEEAQLSLLTAQQQVTAAENRIRGFETERKLLEKSRDLAQLQLQRARLDLKRTKIVAPFSGVVIQNHVELNSEFAASGKVATIEDTASIEVCRSLQSKDVPFVLATGNRASPTLVASLDDGPVQASEIEGDAYRLPPVPVTVEYQRGHHTFRWKGVLSRQDGLGIDQATRTLPVRIHVPDPSGSVCDKPDEDCIALMRGMFVNVRLHCEPETHCRHSGISSSTWQDSMAASRRQAAYQNRQHRRYPFRDRLCGRQPFTTLVWRCDHQFPRTQRT